MKKPIIGLSPQYDYERNRIFIGTNYLDAIRDANGIPILLPLHVNKNELELAANVCDGFLFTGGPDINPYRFGEETLSTCKTIVPERDIMEEDLFNIAMKSKKPILGICRGIQVLNVFLGGTLYQDIPSQFEPKWITDYNNDTSPRMYQNTQKNLQLSHTQESGNSVLTHSIIVENNSLLYEILNKDYIRVNSFHHQGIKDLAPNLKAAAYSYDSLIEAVYLPGHKFFLGVQWHPEHLYRTNEDANKLFQSFVSACSD